ncbi:MAG: hypothetical protein JST86_19515 [Bacteroidetes bacterium]|nr:hypothetical protein [Bacteroidota bacterium]
MKAKKNLLIITWSILMQLNAAAQAKSGMENYSILGSKQSYAWMPVLHHTSKKGMYTELRYNYEAERTGSVYMGKSFSGKRKWEYAITPMAGIVMGNYNGFSLAANMDASCGKMFASMQTQYTINGKTADENFFFNWTEVAFQSTRWLYTGASMQQTKVYHAPLQQEYGLLVGFVFGKFTVPVYIFNPFNAARNCIVGINTAW